MQRLISLLTLLLIASPALAADTRYVSDDLKITLRSGPSTSNKILRLLPVGSPLKVVRVDKASGYTQVRTRGGTQGWVLTRQLSSEPSPRQQLQEATARLSRLESENQTLRQRTEQAQTRYEQTEAERQRLATEQGQTAKDLEQIRETAANTLFIQEENQQLAKKLQKANEDLTNLQEEYELVRNEDARDWFLVGAGVILLGILVGLILPRLRPRRRDSSWNTL